MQRVRFRLDLAPHCSIGPGKVDLLEAIASTGSIRQAARELRMSYRYAWLLVDSLNKSFTEPVTHSSVGGSGGGGVELTAFGAELVKRYKSLAKRFDSVAETELRPIIARLAQSAVMNDSDRTPRAITAPKNRRTGRTSTPMRRRLARPAGGAR